MYNGNGTQRGAMTDKDKVSKSRSERGFYRYTGSIAILLMHGNKL